MKEKEKMTWIGLALIAFTSVWGFGNIINGFSSFNGLHAIIPWVFVLGLYFVPYALMVGELGSAFSNESGGVSSWIKNTINSRIAFFAGWIYWVVHMPYISQKPSTILISASWMIFGKNITNEVSVLVLQLIGLALFLGALLLATRGLSFIRTIASIGGMAIFVLSILFILMMIAAPAITKEAHYVPITWENIKPTFSPNFIFNLSILIFAVGGCEKISPYVNQLKRPGKDFSGGMIALAIMVAICAILGNFAMGMMFDSNNIPNDLIMNGAYYAFQKLGNFYHIGNTLLIIYATANLAVNFAVMVISIDAPLRILLGNADEKYIPKKLLKKNNYGCYTNGILLVGIIVSVLILIPALGIEDVNSLVTWLVKLNSVCMPLRYLFVFLAYIMLKKKSDIIPSGEYVFIKNKYVGIAIGIWCFVITALCCLLGMYSKDPFEMILNIATPIILIAIGFILPAVANRKKKA